jgi:hypothetical protein
MFASILRLFPLLIDSLLVSYATLVSHNCEYTCVAWNSTASTCSFKPESVQSRFVVFRFNRLFMDLSNNNNERVSAG